MKLKLENFPDKGIIRIEGVDYTYEFFKMLGISGLPIGAIVEVKKRTDNSIILERKYETDEEKLSSKYNDLISKLHPPISYVSREERCLNRLIQALHNPLFDLLRNPFKKRKK